MNQLNRITTSLVALGLVGACGTAAATEYGTVLSSTPITRQVVVPRQDCVDQPGYVQAPPSGGGALLGAVIGGLAGNAIGAGAGRALATGVGAVTGAVVGNNVEASNAPAVPVTTTNCAYSRGVESRVVGYDVVYEYNGQQRTTRLARDPGPRIALAVAPLDAPIGAGPADPLQSAAPAPAYNPPAGAYPAYPSTYPSTYPSYPAYPAPVYDPYPYYYGGYPYAYGGPAIFIGGRVGFGGGWHGHHR